MDDDESGSREPSNFGVAGDLINKQLQCVQRRRLFSREV
jgi:hypothetical protein